MNANTLSALQAAPKDCTYFKLRQLLRAVGGHYDAHLGQAGLKTTQFSLLSHLWQLGPVRPGDLAKAMTMDASTLTRNLKPLIDAGWVTVSAGVDGRSRLAQLTQAGQHKREQALAHWSEAQQGLGLRLGAARVSALHVLIDGALDVLAPAYRQPHSDDV